MFFRDLQVVPRRTSCWRHITRFGYCFFWLVRGEVRCRGWYAVLFTWHILNVHPTMGKMGLGVVGLCPSDAKLLIGLSVYFWLWKPNLTINSSLSIVDHLKTIDSILLTVNYCKTIDSILWIVDYTVKSFIVEYQKQSISTYDNAIDGILLGDGRKTSRKCRVTRKKRNSK